MFIANQVRTTRDANGNSRVGWQVFHLRPWDDGSGNHQVTPLGFVDHYYGHGWQEMRKYLPGVTQVTDYTVSPDDYERIKAREADPRHMRRVADAVEGN